ELPGVVTHMRGVNSIDRRLDDHRRRAVSRPCRPGVDHTVHIVGKAGHVEAAVLHDDIHVVGPGAGIDAALRMGQQMAAMRTIIIDRLILLQQFDAATDPLTHQGLLRWLLAMPEQGYRVFARSGYREVRKVPRTGHWTGFWSFRLARLRVRCLRSKKSIR